MSNINRAVISQKEKKSAAAKFSEPCLDVTASEPCTVRVLSDGTYSISIDEGITPSRYAIDLKYFIDED